MGGWIKPGQIKDFHECPHTGSDALPAPLLPFSSSAFTRRSPIHSMLVGRTFAGYQPGYLPPIFPFGHRYHTNRKEGRRGKKSREETDIRIPGFSGILSLENLWGVSKEKRSSEEPRNSYFYSLAADAWSSE